MNRKDFLYITGITAMNAIFKPLQALSALTQFTDDGHTQPVLFLGHGSPMNAIEDNEFVQGFKRLAGKLKRPKAILCISAHWETKGTFVTAMDRPRTIHDFGGFPKALFDVQYPVKGSPELARETMKTISSTQVGLNMDWGLDHGCWSVVKHLFPEADVPVIQMSMDYTKPASYHYQLAKELQSLRRKGILIVGSGNMVHNLGLIAWDKMNTDNYAFEWANEAGTKMKDYILSGNHQALIDYDRQGQSFKLAIPTPEHFMPLIYTLGMKEKSEAISIFNDKAVAGSLTMTSVAIGLS